MDLLDYLASEAEQVEVVELDNEVTSVEFEANKLKTSRVEETRGTAVRIVRHGRLGFAASTDRNAVNKLASHVMESASYGDSIPLHFPGQQEAPAVRNCDPLIAEMPVADLAELGQHMVEMLREVEPEARVNVSMERGQRMTTVRTQAGADIAFESSPLVIGVELLRVENEDVLTLWDQMGVTVSGEDLLTPARLVRERLRRSKTLTSIRSGNMPVLFSPGGSLALWLPLVEGLNGKNVYKSISPMVGKVGEQLFDAKLTVMDDGTLDGRPGSAPYDDEGIPRRCNPLIDHGVLKGFLYDLKTAAQAGAEPTGNGLRELFSPPDISPSNLVIAAGESSLDEMIADIDEGLLVEDLLGLGQGNIQSGAFSNPVALAFKIEKGEIVGRVKDVSIAGNIYELLKDVAAISKEQRWVMNALYAPYMLLPEMNVVSKER